jgi:3-oxoadipate enol-lactonase
VKRPRPPQIYWREGGRGPALVLLNGWSASGLAWPRAWIRELEREFRVIRTDNRGSGFSRFADTPFTMSDLADDVAAVLDEAGVRRATVAGLSMGGMIAQEFALRHPDRVDGLVLIATRAPAPAYHAPTSSNDMWYLLQRPRRNETLAAFFTRMWSEGAAPGFADREPDSISELVRQIVERPTPRPMLMHQLRAVNGWGHAERLGSIKARTVVVSGADDRLATIANGRRLAELIPGARFVELPGVGHLPHLEAPDLVLELIREVTTQPSRPAATDARTAAEAPPKPVLPLS